MIALAATLNQYGDRETPAGGKKSPKRPLLALLRILAPLASLAVSVPGG